MNHKLRLAKPTSEFGWFSPLSSMGFSRDGGRYLYALKTNVVFQLK